MFDKEKFARMLMLAVGDRSLNEYGRMTGISAAHISRLTRGKLDAPPNPQTIKQLTQFAQNGVTYEDMMIVAGHIEPEWVGGPGGIDTAKITRSPRLDVSAITDEEAELISFIRRSWSKLTPEQRKKKLELAKISLRIMDEVDKQK
jgi:hypothetical protein